MLSRFLPEHFSIQMADRYVLCCEIGGFLVWFWPHLRNCTWLLFYFEKKLLISFNFEKGLPNGLFKYSRKAFKSLSAVRVLFKKETILKDDKLKPISNSIIKIISFVLSALASDCQTIQIGRRAGPCHCHLSKTNLQPTAELDVVHH